MWQVTGMWGRLIAMRRVLLLCAIALVGCGKKATCASIAEHVAALATADLEQKAQGADPKLRERLELERKMIPIGQATTRERCQKEAWNQAKIDCVKAAPSMAEVAKCT